MGERGKGVGSNLLLEKAQKWGEGRLTRECLRVKNSGSSEKVGIGIM